MSLETHTPVIRQYLNIKKNYQNELVFFRMGDFYELFFEDAIEASKTLGITLTSRGKSAGKPVLMAGVPVSAHKNYLKRLLDSGKSVAICEQVGDATISKGLVQRKVVRVVTAGTLCDSGLVSENKQTWLFSVNMELSVSWIDVSTGELFWFTPDSKAGGEEQTYVEQVITVISKYDVGEVLVPDVQEDFNWKKNNLKFKNFYLLLKEVIPNEKIIPRPTWDYDAKNGGLVLQKRLKISTLEALELTSVDSVLESVSALMNYVEKNIGQPVNHLRFPKKINQSEIVIIDAVAQKSLKLKKPLHDETKKNITLISCMDKCQTSGGSRLLNNWILSPLKNNQLLRKRQKSIDWISGETTIHTALVGFIDISRVAGRISLGNTSPRELISLSLNLCKLVNLSQLLKKSNDEYIKKIYQIFSDFKLTLIIERISNCLSEQPGNKINDGGFIKDGFDKTLDDFRSTRKKSDFYLDRLEIEEKEKTGISNLKIGYSPVHGFFFEVTSSQKNKVPENYTRRQTLKNSERFITSELKAHEEKILCARENSLAREKVIFQNLLIDLQKKINFLFELSESLSLLDVFATLSLKISQNNWIIPELSDDSEISITQGSHPVLVANKNSINFENNFYPNDTELHCNENMMLLTGPNMSGKSTYMKQVALITILGRIGAPVPASKARIGIIDRIFTRIGAADDLAGGRSTFMVEMTEAARILHESTNKSLVLLDEIGRGTSTADGLALAIAIATELSLKNKALCLFATHYFEITELEKTTNRIKNFHISTEEKDDQITFLYELKLGPASKSFGLKVAKLAGIPLHVIQHAEKITIPSYSNITHEKKLNKSEQCLNQELLEGIALEIKNIEPNDCTPTTALELLFKWNNILNNNKN